MKDWFVTLELAEKLTPPSYEMAKKTSSEVKLDWVLSRLSYHATSTKPPAAVIVGKKCWPVSASFILRGGVHVDPPSVERVRNTLAFPSLMSSNVTYTPRESAAI